MSVILFRDNGLALGRGRAEKLRRKSLLASLLDDLLKALFAPSARERRIKRKRRYDYQKSYMEKHGRCGWLLLPTNDEQWGDQVRPPP